MRTMALDRDRDERGRPRNARPRDELGRPLPHGAEGIVEEHLPDDPEELLQLGIDHFNAGRTFQAHEAWETAWHPSAEDERDFWQGLTQVAVGYTHLKRGNAHGAVTLLRRGAGRLEPYGEAHRGVRVADLAARARADADEIERGGASAAIDPPPVSRG